LLGLGAPAGVPEEDEGLLFFFPPITPAAYRDPTITDAHPHKTKIIMNIVFGFILLFE
jgi:hypothetical protein